MTEYNSELDDNIIEVIERLVLEKGLKKGFQDIEKALLKSLYEQYPSSRNIALALQVSHTTICNKINKYGIQKNKPLCK